MSSNLNTALEWLAKILSALVIPTLFWINSLEVERALQTKSIQQLESKVTKNSEEIDKVQQLVATNALTLNRIEVTLESLDRTLQEVRQSLRGHEQLHTSRRPHNVP